jgi:hypothetical protein
MVPVHQMPTVWLGLLKGKDVFLRPESRVEVVRLGIGSDRSIFIFYFLFI